MRRGWRFNRQIKDEEAVALAKIYGPIFILKNRQEAVPLYAADPYDNSYQCNSLIVLPDGTIEKSCFHCKHLVDKLAGRCIYSFDSNKQLKKQASISATPFNKVRNMLRRFGAVPIEKEEIRLWRWFTT